MQCSDHRLIVARVVQVKKGKVLTVPQKVLFSLTVMLDAYKSHKIVVREGDNLFGLAMKFVIINKLPHWKAEEVLGLLKKNFEYWKGHEGKESV